MTKFDYQEALEQILSGKLTLNALPSDQKICTNLDCESGTIYTRTSHDRTFEARPCPTCAERRRREKALTTLKTTGVAETSYAVPQDKLELTDEGWQLAHEYALRVTELVRAGSGLIFSGHCGRGKTHAAKMILEHAAKAGHTVTSVQWGRFVQAVHGTFRSKERPSEDDMISGLVFPDLVLLDDVGATDNQTEYNKRLLTAVINGRYDARRSTILTSNLDREDLEKHLGERAWSRLWNNCAVVLFTGPDYRRQLEKPRTKNLHDSIRESAAQRATERS